MMNQRLSQKINLMSRLLHLLKDSSLHESTRLIMINLIRVLLVTYKNTNDILKYNVKYISFFQFIYFFVFKTWSISCLSSSIKFSLRKNYYYSWRLEFKSLSFFFFFKYFTFR